MKSVIHLFEISPADYVMHVGTYDVEHYGKNYWPMWCGMPGAWFFRVEEFDNGAIHYCPENGAGALVDKRHEGESTEALGYRVRNWYRDQRRDYYNGRK